MKNYWKATLPVLGALLFAAPQARSQITPYTSVLAAGAVSGTDGTIRLSGTLGQAAIGNIYTDATTLAQGFWHAFPRVAATTGPEQPTTGSDPMTLQSSPNPFSGSTQLSFRIPHTGHVSLTLYDLLGQPVRTLLDSHQTEGTATMNLPADDLPSGRYTLVLKSGNEERAISLLLVK